MRYFEFVVGVDIGEVHDDDLIDVEDVIAHAIYENFGWGVIVDYHREITVED